MVEEEIARLEREISKVQEGLQNVQGAEEHPKFANGDVAKPPVKMLNAMPSLPNGKVLQDKIELETKSMFYINQAIKGDLLINGLSKKVGAGRLTRSDQHNESQRMMQVKDRTSKKGGITEKVTLPKLSIKHLTIKVSPVLILWPRKVGKQVESHCYETVESKYEHIQFFKEETVCCLILFRLRRMLITETSS